MRSGAILSTRVCLHSAQCPGWWWESGGGHWRPCPSRQGTWLEGCQEVGQELGQRGGGHQQCLCSCMKDLLSAPAQSVAPCWGPACMQEQVICRPQAPRGTGAVLLPSRPWWQLALQNGGGLGFAGCSWGCRFLRCLRATPHLGEHGPSGRCLQLRSDTEAMESGWDDRGLGEKENRGHRWG